MLRLTVFAVVSTALAALSSGGGAGHAQTAPAGAVAIALLLPTNRACPAGIEAASHPVPDDGIPAMLAIVVPPGPAGCAGGIALSVELTDPLEPSAPAPDGTGVGLPLTAASCEAGTAVLEGIAAMLDGGAGGGGAPAPDGVCPAGAAALAAIEAVIVLFREPFDPAGGCAGGLAPLPSWRGRTLGTGVFFPPSPGMPECPPGTMLLLGFTLLGSPAGFMHLDLLAGVSFAPGLFYGVRPSLVRGVSLITPASVQR